MDKLNSGILSFIAPRCFWRRDYIEAASAEIDIVAMLGSKPSPPTLAVDRGVARIPVRGIIMKGGGFMYSESTSTVTLKNLVRQAISSNKVKSILLSIDSPGGYVDGLVETAELIYQARQVKPVVAQVDGMAASAAYWLASQAESIFAGEGDVVGSIGVYSVIDDYSKMFENEGVKVNLITTGPYKGAGEMGVEVTKEQLAYLQEMVNDYFELFLTAIERGRTTMSRDALMKVADGREFIARKAVAANLIDGVQSYEDTFATMQRVFNNRNAATESRRLSLGIRLAEALSADADTVKE